MSLVKSAVVITAIGMFGFTAAAQDSAKQGRPAAAQSRAPEWERRTDTEWRRYTDGRVAADRQNARMRRLDTDRNGAVSREEWRGSDRAFSRLDRDSDGVITSRDRDLRRSSPRSADRYTRRNDRFRVLDRNGDGIISQDEWNRR